MSRKLATIIKDSKIPGKWKRVAEAYAAFANNDGTNIRPSQTQLGTKSGTSRWTCGRNTAELIESGILRRAKSHTCKVKECNKGATHFTGTWGRYTLVYEIDITLLQNAERYLGAKQQKVNGAKCRKVMGANCYTTLALPITPAPDALALVTTPDSSALTGGNKKESKEPLLASLVAEVDHPATQTNPDLLSNLDDGLSVEPIESVSECKTKQPQPQRPDAVLFSHPSCWSLQRIWKNRTGYLFTDEDFILADKLIRTYRYRVVEAVLRNTLHERPESAKLRWNKFAVFARNWDRNHESYLAYCATAHLDKKRGSYKPPAQKFDTVPEDDQVDPKEWDSLIEWFQEHGKIGEWNLPMQEWEAMGLRHGHVYTAMKFCGEESIPVTKEQFISLLLECAELKAVGESLYACACGKGCRGFCPVEVAMEVAE